jgi:hypothetical protein
MIRELMAIPVEHGVCPENIEIYEYSGDSIYGAGVANEGDFAPLLEEDYVPKGKNLLGPIVSALARQAIKGTHAEYVSWFEANYPPFFVLDPAQPQEEEAVHLGARTASEADLPSAPQGRTGSNSRSA